MMNAWKAALALSALAWGVAAISQPVYKWVDANGKTHYGSQPPASQDEMEPLKLQSTNGTTTGSGGSASGTGSKGGSGAGGAKKAEPKGGTEYNADGTKKVPQGVQEMADGLRKSLQTVDGKQVPMNCAVAVSNIQYQADQMLEVGQKNVRDGYMTQAAFDETAPKIREAKGKYSVGDCQSSAGEKRSFYQCMSSSYNHVTGCAKQFKH